MNHFVCQTLHIICNWELDEASPKLKKIGMLGIPLYSLEFEITKTNLERKSVDHFHTYIIICLKDSW